MKINPSQQRVAVCSDKGEITTFSLDPTRATRNNKQPSVLMHVSLPQVEQLGPKARITAACWDRRGDLLVVGSLGGIVMSVDFTAYFSATETLLSCQNTIINLDFAPKLDERLLLISCRTRVLVVDLDSPAGSALLQIGTAFTTGKAACGACFGFKEHQYAIFSPKNRTLLSADSDTGLDCSEQTQWQPCRYSAIPTVEGDSHEHPLLRRLDGSRSTRLAATNICLLSRFRGGLDPRDAMLLNVVYIPAADGNERICHWTLLRVTSVKPLRTEFVLANRDLGSDLVYMSVCEDAVGSTIFAVAQDSAGATRLAKITAHSTRALVRSVGKGVLSRSLQVVMCHRIKDEKVLTILLNSLCKKLRLLLSTDETSTAGPTIDANTNTVQASTDRSSKPTTTFESLFLGKKKGGSSAHAQPAWLSGDLSSALGERLSDWCALASAFATFCAGSDGLAVMVESLNDFVKQAQAIIRSQQQHQQQQQQQQLEQPPPPPAPVTPVRRMSAQIAAGIIGEWRPVPVTVAATPAVAPSTRSTSSPATTSPNDDPSGGVRTRRSRVSIARYVVACVFAFTRESRETCPHGMVVCFPMTVTAAHVRGRVSVPCRPPTWVRSCLPPH